MGVSKLRWGYSKHGVKSASECLVRVVACIEGYVGYRLFLELQTDCGAFQTQAANVLLHGLANQAAKYTMKVIGRKAGNPGKVLERESLVEMLLDVDQRAQDAFVVSDDSRFLHTLCGCLRAIQTAPVRNAGYKMYPAPISE